MQRIFNRVYYLRTLTREELIVESRISIILFILYLFTVLMLLILGNIDPSPIYSGLLCGIMLFGFLFYIDSTRFQGNNAIRDTVLTNSDKDENTVIEKTNEALKIESTQEDIQFFSFDTRVIDVFDKYDPQLMSELLSNKNQYLIEEVARSASKIG